MKLRFTKLSGAGNDFILLESALLPKRASAGALAKRLCPRRTSVGADGLLLVERSGAGKYALRYFNADGSEAFCGNGARCAAWWMHRMGRVGKRFLFETIEGPLEARVTGAERLRLRMPDARRLRTGLRLSAVGKVHSVSTLDTGVPHAVVRVPANRLPGFPVISVGRALRRHRAFKPRGANINFVSLQNGRAALRTYERGVEDETLACGTGVVAAAILAAQWSGRRAPIGVRTRGGAVLSVRFKPASSDRFESIWLEGPARITYEGEARL